MDEGRHDLPGDGVAPFGRVRGAAGSTSATSGDSSITQTFVAGASSLSFWYRPACTGTVARDWATATLRDNVAGTTATILPKTCANSATWQKVSAAVVTGRAYTLSLVNHDDGSVFDATYTLFDDATVGSAPTPPQAPAGPIYGSGISADSLANTQVGQLRVREPHDELSLPRQHLVRPEQHPHLPDRAGALRVLRRDRWEDPDRRAVRQ